MFDDSDVMRHEVRALVERGKPVIVVLTPEAPPPHLWQLPPDLARLSQIQAVTITTSGWEIVMDQLIRTFRPMLRMTGTDAPQKGEERTPQPVVEVETVAT